MIMLVTVKGEPLTFRGALILHDGPTGEVEFLLPSVGYYWLPPWKAERVAQHYGMPVMMLADHPDLASVRWPLRKEDFRGH